MKVDITMPSQTCTLIIFRGKDLTSRADIQRIGEAFAGKFSLTTRGNPLERPEFADFIQGIEDAQKMASTGEEEYAIRTGLCADSPDGHPEPFIQWGGKALEAQVTEDYGVTSGLISIPLAEELAEET